MSNREDFNAAVRVIENDVLPALRNGWQPEGLAVKAETAYRALRDIAYAAIPALSTTQLASVEAAFVSFRDLVDSVMPAMTGAELAAKQLADAQALRSATPLTPAEEVAKRQANAAAGVTPLQVQAESDRLDALVADGTLTRAKADAQLATFRANARQSVPVPALPTDSAIQTESNRLDALVAAGTLTRSQAAQQLADFRGNTGPLPPLPPAVPNTLIEPSTRRTTGNR